MEIAVGYLEDYGLPVWLIILVFIILRLSSNPLGAIMKWRSFGLKNDEFRLDVLARLELSEPVRYAMLDAIERDEFHRATGMRLSASKRAVVSEVVNDNPDTLSWADFRSALPFLDFKDGLEIKWGWKQIAIYGAARYFTIFMLLTAYALLAAWMLLMFSSGKLHLEIFILSVLYIALWFVARVVWVHPYESAKTIKGVLQERDKKADHYEKEISPGFYGDLHVEGDKV